MTSELLLKPACSRCGTTSDLYGSNCRHLTLCPACGKSMVESSASCSDCGVPVTRLIREYNVKAHALNKQYFVGRFLQGVPMFSKKKSPENRWVMQREGIQGRQLTEALREKYKGKPWLLEDDQGQQQYQGQVEGGQQAIYYLLMMHGKDFLAMPAGAWHNFHKVPHYKQLTLEEAEEQMKNRRKTADGYQRWMMKAANTGAAAFGEVEKFGGGGGGRGGRQRRGGDSDEDAALSEKGEEDEDEEEARKNRLRMNKKGGDEDGEEPARGDDLDLEDDELEKGDDWEHEETFTDDDEAVGNDPEEREDQAPELPAPPEIKQDEEDEEDGEEDREDEAGGLSKSGRELKKLLGKSAGLDESDDDFDEEDEDIDQENEDNTSPVLAPKHKDFPKEEPADIIPSKSQSSINGRAPPVTAAIAKNKRKTGAEDVKGNVLPTAKKLKAEPVKEDIKGPALVKKEPIATPAKVVASPAKAAATTVAKAVPQASGSVTEEEVRTVLKQMGPVKSQDLVAKFKTRLRTPEDKSAFAEILKKISRIQKTTGANFIVLRDK